MKKISRVLSMLLVLAAIFSCIGGGALAASSKDTVKKYGKDGGLVVFGDSISRGCAIELAERYKDFAYRNVYGAYPCLLAEAVGCVMPDLFADLTDEEGNPVNYWPACFPGQSLHMMMDWLDWTDEDDAWEVKWQNAMVACGLYFENEFINAFGGEGSDLATARKNLLEAIGKADLIVIEQGMSDVFARTIFDLLVSGATATDAAQSPVEEAIVEDTVVVEDTVAEDAASGGESGNAAIAEQIINELYQGYKHWVEEYPVFVQKLRELNPDAYIVMLGSFNPGEGLRLTEESLLDVGNVLTAITATMNRNYQSWYRQFRDAGDNNICYVDISNTESLACTYDFSLENPMLIDELMASVHPNSDGYAYIYRQILAALPEDEEIVDPVYPPEPIIKTFHTDLKLDLGRFDHVNYVMLDGKKLSKRNYSMNNSDNPFELTVHCNKKSAKSLLISVMQEDGKIATYTYQLSYDDTQYTAHRVYSTNDTVKTANIFAKTIYNVGSAILKVFSGLFKTK